MLFKPEAYYIVSKERKDCRLRLYLFYDILLQKEEIIKERNGTLKHLETFWICKQTS